MKIAVIFVLNESTANNQIPYNQHLIIEALLFTVNYLVIILGYIK